MRLLLPAPLMLDRPTSQRRLPAAAATMRQVEARRQLPSPPISSNTIMVTWKHLCIGIYVCIVGFYMLVRNKTRKSAKWKWPSTTRTCSLCGTLRTSSATRRSNCASTTRQSVYALLSFVSVHHRSFNFIFTLYIKKSERGKRLREEHERITKTFETCTKLVATLAPTVTLPNKITALLLSSPPQSRQTQQLPQQVQNTPSSSATSPKKTDRSLSATNATSPILITITKTATVSIERLDSAKMASPKKVVHKSSDAATTTATTTATLTNHKPKQPMHKPLSTEKQANLNAEWVHDCSTLCGAI